MEAHALLARIVVAEANRRHPKRAVGKHLADDDGSRIASPDDEHLAAAWEQRAPTLKDRAGNCTNANRAEQQQQEVDHEDAARRRRSNGWEQVGVERDDHDSNQRGAQQQANVAERDVAPPARIEAIEYENRDRQHHNPWQGRPEQRVRPDRHDVETQLEREPPGRRSNSSISR